MTPPLPPDAMRCPYMVCSWRTGHQPRRCRNWKEYDKDWCRDHRDGKPDRYRDGKLTLPPVRG